MDTGNKLEDVGELCGPLDYGPIKAVVLLYPVHYACFWHLKLCTIIRRASIMTNYSTNRNFSSPCCGG